MIEFGDKMFFIPKTGGVNISGFSMLVIFFQLAGNRRKIVIPGRPFCEAAKLNISPGVLFDKS